MQRKNTRTWTYLNKAGKTCIITLETKREEKIKEKSNFFLLLFFFNDRLPPNKCLCSLSLA